VEHFSVFEARKLSNAGQHLPGSPSFAYMPQLISGKKQALGMVYGAIQAQAAMLSFNDIYRVLAVATFIMIPSFLFLRGVKGSGASAGH
jgi:hypothetical protein